MARFTTSYMTDPEDEDLAIAGLTGAPLTPPSAAPDTRSFAVGSPDVRELEMPPAAPPRLPTAAAVPRAAAASPSPFAGSGGAPDVSSDDEPSLNGWALLASVLLNKGRDLPGLLTQADAQKRQWRKDKQTAADQDIERAFRRQQLEIGQGNLAARNREISANAERAEFERDRMLHPEKYPLTQEQKERQAAREMSDWQASDASARAWQAQEEAGKQREADAADRRAARGIQYAQLAETKRAHDLAAEDRNDRERAVADAKEAQFMTGYAKNTEGARKSLKSLQEIEAITGRYKDDPNGIPGLDAQLALGESANDAVNALARGYKKMRGTYTAADESREADADTVRKLLTEVGEATLRDETGAAASLSEVQRNKIRHAMGASATQEQRLEALRIAGDAQRGALQGFAAANPRAARRVLESEGIRADFIRDPSMQAPEALQPTAAMPSDAATSWRDKWKNRKATQ